MMIQEQRWCKDYLLLIVDEQGHGSVQVHIPASSRKRVSICGDALILLHWVDPGYRRKGVGKRLIEAAIKELKGRGLRAVSLKWKEEESARLYIYNWYRQLGFTEVRESKGIHLMTKRI